MRLNDEPSLRAPGVSEHASCPQEQPAHRTFADSERVRNRGSGRTTAHVLVVLAPQNSWRCLSAKFCVVRGPAAAPPRPLGLCSLPAVLDLESQAGPTGARTAVQPAEQIFLPWDKLPGTELLGSRALLFTPASRKAPHRPSQPPSPGIFCLTLSCQVDLRKL